MKVIALKNIILEKNTITYKFDIPEELRNSKIYIVDSVYWDDDGNCNVVSNSY